MAPINKINFLNIEFYIINISETTTKGVLTLNIPVAKNIEGKTPSQPLCEGWVTSETKTEAEGKLIQMATEEATLAVRRRVKEVERAMAM